MVLKKLAEQIQYFLSKTFIVVPVLFSVVSLNVLLLLVFEQLTTTHVVLLSTPMCLFIIRFFSKLDVPDSDSATTKLIDIGALICILCWTIFNIGYSSQSVFLTRDPGVYTVTAKWLTQHKTTNMDYERLPNNEDVFYQSLGVWLKGEAKNTADDVLQNEDIESGTDWTYGGLQPQGAHLLPGLLSTGYDFFGDWFIYNGNIVFAGIALGALYGFAKLIMRRWWAFSAVAILSVSLPFIYFSRDTYTEIISMVFLGSMLTLVALGEKCKHYTLWQTRTLWLLIGLTTGAIAMSRPDGYLPAIAPILLLLYKMSFSKKTLYSYHISFLIGYIPAVLIAYIDISKMAVSYYQNIGDGIVKQLYVILALSFAGPIFALIMRRKGRKILAGIKNKNVILKKTGTLCALLILAIFSALLSRPLWTEQRTSAGLGYAGLVIGNIQSFSGDAVDTTRNYGEHTLDWVGWYIGYPVLLLGVIGMSLAAYLVIAKKRHILSASLIVVGSLWLFYTIKPKITPDQIWAARRFLPVVIPGLIVYASFAVDYLHNMLDKKTMYFKQTIMVLISILLILPVLNVSGPFIRLRQKPNHAEVVLDFCRKLPEDAYIIWLGSSLTHIASQTVRTYCGIQSAGISKFYTTEDDSQVQVYDVEKMKLIKEDINKAGHTPVLAIMGSRKSMYDLSLFDSFTPAIIFKIYDVEQTLERPPAKIQESFESIEIASLSASGNPVTYTFD